MFSARNKKRLNKIIKAYPLSHFICKWELCSYFRKSINIILINIINEIKGYFFSPIFGRIWFGLLFFILYGCANKVAITGGAKDVTPPQIISTNPDAGSINYKSNSIVLRFDEYVKLNNFQSAFISSPPLKTLPNYHIKKKSIVLKIYDQLIDSTTYILDFGGSIQDITEGNALQNYQFAFSTGTYIDSLKLSGIIRNASDLKPEKNIAIMLYKKNLIIQRATILRQSQN